MRTLVSILINAVGLWLTTMLLSAGMSVTPYEETPVATVLTYLALGAIWGVVNGFIGSVIRTAGFCLYILTLGLIALIVNGFLFWLVAWISEQLGWGLTVNGFWWAVLGAIVLSILTTVLGAIFKPRERERPRERRAD